MPDPIPVHKLREFADAEMSACGEPLFMPAAAMQPGEYPARLCPACWPELETRELVMLITGAAVPAPNGLHRARVIWTTGPT